MLKLICAFFVLFCQYCVAEENNLFLYNNIENCKETEHFDVSYLKCKLCDPKLHLVPTKNSKYLKFKILYHFICRYLPI